MNSAAQTPYYREKLRQELASRCERNPRYSVRAYAMALELDAGTLSKLLNGKQIPSYKLSERLMKGLCLGQQEQEMFLSSVVEIQKNRQLQRLSPRLRAYQTTRTTADLSLDLYRIVSDWHHFAILELTYHEDFDSSPRWIAKELGISVIEAQMAVDRMLQFNLLKRHKNTLVKTNEQLSSVDKHLTTPAHKKNQKQFLEKAITSLENDPLEERSMTSMTMNIDPEKIPVAKRMIRDFNQALCQYLETGKRKRVYNMQISLYPLQKKSKPKTGAKA